MNIIKKEILTLIKFHKYRLNEKGKINIKRFNIKEIYLKLILKKKNFMSINKLTKS